MCSEVRKEHQGWSVTSPAALSGAVRAGCPGQETSPPPCPGGLWVLPIGGSFVCCEQLLWLATGQDLAGLSLQGPPLRPHPGGSGLAIQPPQRRAPGAGGQNVVTVVGTSALSLWTHFSAVHFGANVGLDSKLIGDVFREVWTGDSEGVMCGFLANVFTPFTSLPSWGLLHVLAQRLGCGTPGGWVLVFHGGRRCGEPALAGAAIGEGPSRHRPRTVVTARLP